MGVAMEMALAQLWPGMLGMLDGKRRVTVGTVHATSPMSSDPPPVRCASGVGPSRRPRLRLVIPLSATPSSRWMPLASARSLSSHVGMPTVLMFWYIASATGREKCPLHPEPTIITVSTAVPVIIAAPFALSLASSNMASVFS